MPAQGRGTSRWRWHFQGSPLPGCLAVQTLCFALSHDFIGEFATSYRELSRAQSQFTVYEVGQRVRARGREQGTWGMSCWRLCSPVPAGAEPQEEM